MSGSEFDPPQHTVISFVPGTYSFGAWTRPNAPFRTAIEAELGPQTVFRTFSWSGWNGQKSRILASLSLREFLLDGLREHPDARHVIIAHSHGGNVALYALRDRALRERIAGLVCLATPFINTKPRRPSTRAVIAWGLPLLVLFPLLCGVIWLAQYMLRDMWEGWSLWRIVSLIGSGILVFKLLQILYLSWRISVDWLSRLLKRWLRRQLRRAARCYPRIRAGALPVLAVTAPQDEAHLLLRSVQTLGDAPLGLLYNPVFCGISFLWTCVAIFNNLTAATGSDFSAWKYAILVAPAMAFSGALLGAQIILLTPFATMFQMVARGHPLGYGIEHFLLNIVVRIRSVQAGSVPRLNPKTLSWTYREWRGWLGWKTLFSLRHSWVYRAANVPLQSIAQWIKDLPVPAARTAPMDLILAPQRNSREIVRAFRSTWIERSLAGGLFVLLAMVVFGIDSVQSTDMSPALAPGDHVLIYSSPLSLFSSEKLRRGDVVAVDFAPAFERSQESREPMPYVWSRVYREAQTGSRWVPWLRSRTHDPDPPRALTESDDPLTSLCHERAFTLNPAPPVEPDEVLLKSDNPASRHDSRCFGPIPAWYVGGKVVLRWPGRMIWRARRVCTRPPSS
jgi:hypothetical protein